MTIPRTLGYPNGDFEVCIAIHFNISLPYLNLAGSLPALKIVCRIEEIKGILGESVWQSEPTGRLPRLRTGTASILAIVPIA